MRQCHAIDPGSDAVPFCIGQGAAAHVNSG
jgi:hypothetical protein